MLSRNQHAVSPIKLPTAKDGNAMREFPHEFRNGLKD
jgi:hypothetical protein